MSDPLITCPSCGSEVPEGRFCKICGKPLNKEVPPDSSDIESQLEEESTPVAPVLVTSVFFPADSYILYSLSCLLNVYRYCQSNCYTFYQCCCLTSTIEVFRILIQCFYYTVIFKVK